LGVSEYLPDLMKKNVFETHFCLHEKREQKELKQSWARWSACFRGQPITNVRNYLGENVALYFLWLGWYTFLLIPASVIGLVVFLYGLAFYSTSPLMLNIVICADTVCFGSHVQVSLLFDNEGTVAFAMFMAVWATVFLEFWKCHRSSYVSAWKVFDWCEEEEELILEIVNNAHCEPKMHRHSYLRSTIVLLLVIIGLTHVLVVSRVIATVLLAENSTWQVITENSQTVAVMLGAVLHYITITVMTQVKAHKPPTVCQRMDGCLNFVLIKSYFFCLLFTIRVSSNLCFRINGHPGGYVRISGKWRLEECHPSGCLTDLFIQLSIIMVLKQTFNNIFEYSDLHRNYSLIKTDRFSLFNEFLEMVIQFSFTTIFVAAFPLAPLLALLNNIIEIRLDAIKMVSLERRLVPMKANDIGVWTDVLEAIGVLAVIANGLVIGISSDFIPRLVYQYFYGPCASGSATGIDGINVTHCSYRDYRSNEDFSLTNQYWVILAARLVFIILFEHVVVIFKCVASWFVPTSPLDVTNERLYDKLRRLKEELRSVTRAYTL
uniref:Anoctamin n=1 Tax=Cyprinus carpio TaxID=7962 RepID=A0A8C2DCP9_CYPCA